MFQNIHTPVLSLRITWNVENTGRVHTNLLESHKSSLSSKTLRLKIKIKIKLICLAEQ